jgi:hypothetical protein
MIMLQIPDYVLVNDLSRALRTIGLAVVYTGPSAYEVKPVVVMASCAEDGCKNSATIKLEGGDYCSFHAIERVRSRG